MSGSISESKMRSAAVEYLEAEGYTVRDISSGSGVPKLSRLELKKGPEFLKCAVKTTAKGRISFARDDEGHFKVLDGFDLVLHVQPVIDETGVTAICLSLFSKERVLEAFEQNYAALQEDENSHLPSWLSPTYEEGRRFIGSGFGKDALWSEIVAISDISGGLKNGSSEDDGEELGVMDHIKAMLSDHLGVRPDQVEVDVRVKI